MKESDQKKYKKFYATLKERTGEKKFALIFSVLQIYTIQDTTVVFSVPAELFKQKVIDQKAVLLELCNEFWDGIKNIEIQVHAESNAAMFLDSTDFNAPPKIAPKVQSKASAKNTFLELRSDFTFDNFLVGPSNEFAASIAKAIAKNPGQTSYNPCLIYGKVGLGKTHLLQAIGNEVKQSRPQLEILYLTIEQFVNDFIGALKNNTMHKFRDKFRTVNLLLVDDIQFLSGKEQTQDELFHTFNALHHNFRQMVFSSDRPINLIKDVEERLISRFQSGMSVDLRPPTTEMAIGILRGALEINGKEDVVSFEIIEYISTHLRNNVRNMLAFLNRIIGYVQITGKTVTLEMAREWALNFLPRKEDGQNLRDKIVKEVANFYEIGVSELKGGSRKRVVSKIRRIAMYLLREHTDLSHTEIGNIFNVSHVSCLNAVEKVENEIDVGADLSEIIVAIKSKIFE